jgi:tripartite-type tricarboxylate transporter receptor subunit TctC
MKRRIFSSAALALAAGICMNPAQAQPWPNKPLTLVVGFAPGGGVDYVMRTIAPELSKRLGQPVVIDNKPGASGMLAGAAVVKSQPDGHTLLGTDGGAMVLNSVLYAKVPYDVGRDLTPISQLIRVPLLVVAHPSFPATDISSLVELSKKQALNYASPGKGTYHHLAMEQLKKRAGFEAQDVAYRGAGPAAQEVISGQVPFAVLDTVVALPNIRAGRLKPIAVLSSARLAALPQVPTVLELGVKDAEASAWIGVMAPKAIPSEVAIRLNAELRAALNTPEIQKRFTDMGMEPIGGTPQAMAAAIDADSVRYHPLVKSLGMQLD